MMIVSVIHPFQSTAESLLRSALQGKGYGLTVMGSPTSLSGSSGGGGRKGDDELRRVMFGTEQVTISICTAVYQPDTIEANVVVSL